jgi:hypothetical protein
MTLGKEKKSKKLFPELMNCVPTNLKRTVTDSTTLPLIWQVGAKKSQQ